MATDYTPSISDNAVKAKTGKDWRAWFALMDKVGANKLTHKDIAALLHNKYKVPDWWSQMVTVEYERSRGLRVRFQQAGGFTLNVSKTLSVDLTTLYRTVSDAKQRARWFPKEPCEITSTTDLKYFRARSQGDTRLEINTYAKGKGKSQITIQQSRFKSEKAMETMRDEWKKAIERLTALLT
ncbi:MAG: hypothetical protein GC190_18845 [Alphaproteobacteria bacterium]|nr:hypothetical protein [Alphaproteobacteria bacterium]